MIELLAMLLPIAVAWGFDKRQGIDLEKKITELEDVNKSQWEKIDMNRDALVDHEKIDIENKSILELKIATLHGRNERFESMLESINKKLDEFILEWKHDRDKNG